MVKMKNLKAKRKIRLKRVEPEHDRELVCYMEHLEDDRVYIILQNPFDLIGCPAIWRYGKWIKRNWRTMDAKVLSGVRNLKTGYTYLQIGDHHGYCIKRTDIVYSRKKPAEKAKVRSASLTLKMRKKPSGSLLEPLKPGSKPKVKVLKLRKSK